MNDDSRMRISATFAKMTKKHLKHTSTSIVRNICERHVVWVEKVRSQRHRISAVCCQQASTTSVFRKLWRSQGIMAWFWRSILLNQLDTVLCHLIVFTSIKIRLSNSACPSTAPALDHSRELATHEKVVSGNHLHTVTTPRFQLHVQSPVQVLPSSSSSSSSSAAAAGTYSIISNNPQTKREKHHKKSERMNHMNPGTVH